MMDLNQKINVNITGDNSSPPTLHGAKRRRSGPDEEDEENGTHKLLRITDTSTSTREGITTSKCTVRLRLASRLTATPPLLLGSAPTGIK